MLGSTYSAPTLPAGAQVGILSKQDAKANKLTPLTPVNVINRGTEPLVLKYDGDDYQIPPFTFNGGTHEAPYLVQMPYGAAMLFQRHAIIPGTLSPENINAFSSFLGIFGVDAPDACAPLAPEDLARVGHQFEAFDREGEKVTVLDVKQQNRRGVASSGMGNAPRAPQSTVSTLSGEELDPRDVMGAPDGVSDEIRAEAQDGEAALAAAGPVAGRRRR